MVWFLKTQKQTFLQPHGKLEVFVRHCFFSTISQHKKRFPDFSREKCHQNLINTIDKAKANLTFFLDTAKGQDHFIKREENVIEIQAGSEATSFLKLLDHIESLSLHPDTVLYFVEDDYLHKAGWVDVLFEGIAIADYATLYDHKDKYSQNLKSQIFHTKTCHWRITPSTTQTFAVRWKTLREDLPIHRKFSQGRQISQDHQKFLQLSKRGRVLISSLPGYSTHAEPEFASPCCNWNQIQEFSCKHSPSN